MFWNVPAAQLAHRLWPGEPVNVPASQAGHDEAPRFGLAVPGSQDWHMLAPLDAWNVPAAQLVHEVWPAESVNVPGSQDWHVLAPPDPWNVPGPQPVHVVWPLDAKNAPAAEQSCAVAGVVIALVRLRTTNAANARSGDRRAIDFPFPQSRSEEHTSELQSLRHLVCRLLLEKKKVYVTKT